HYVDDGNDVIMQETSTKDTNHPIEGSTFLPAEAFPKPLAWTWADTKGADLSWVPIGFEKSFQLAYSRTHYGTGYYIFDRYVPGAKLSKEIKSWDGKTPPDADVRQMLSHNASEFVADKQFKPFPKTLHLDGPAVIRALAFSFP